MVGHKSLNPVDLGAILPPTTSSSATTTAGQGAAGYVRGSGAFAGLLHALAGARTLKAQVDAMDVLKERLKLNQGRVEAEAAAEEEGYLLMLRLLLDPRAVALRKASTAAHRIAAQVAVLAGAEFEERVVARFLREWTEGLADVSSLVALNVIEELAAFSPARRALCRSAGRERGERRPNAHMAALVHYVLRASTETAAAQAGETQHALTALKALGALLATWRLESSSDGSLVAALQEDQPAFVPSLAQALVAFVGSPLLPYEVKNQAALVLVLAALDSAATTTAATDDDAPGPLAQALAVCFLPTVEAPPLPSSPLLAPLHPAFRGLPSALGPLLHASSSPATASEARLALARAVLVATDLSVLTAALPPALPLVYDGTLMGGPILALVLAECQSPFPPSRLLAFTAMEAWLGRALECCRRRRQSGGGGGGGGGVVGPLALRTALPAAANLLFWNWETSNKNVATVVPQAFDRLVQLLQALEEGAGGGGESSSVGLSIPGLASLLGQQAPTRRSRYAGLRALLPLLGPHELLKRCPDLIPSLLAAVTAGGNTAARASRLFLLVLQMLMPSAEKERRETEEEEEGKVAAVRALWLRPVGQALLHPHRPARTRVADYLLQELVAMDPWASLALLSEIRALSATTAASRLQLDDTALWALLSVADVTRALGGVGPVLGASLELLPAAARAPSSSPMVTKEEARRAGVCGDCDVRYACLRMAIASPKTTTLPTEGEQALVEEVLSVSLKAPLSGQRHGLVRAFRVLFARYREALRIHGADRAKGKGRGNGAAVGEAGTALERAERAVASVTRILCESMYPGTNVSRDAAALDLLALLLSATASGPLDPTTHRRALAPLLASPTAVRSLINLFLAPWERTRRQAFDLLVAFPPGPLPGLVGDDGSVDPTAVHWAKQLSLSARRREAEAGALMLRLLFQRTCLLATDEGACPIVPLLPNGASAGGEGSAAVLFLRGLRRLIEERLAGYERGLEAWSAGQGEGEEGGTTEIVMAFGAIQAARFVLEEAAASSQQQESSEAWGVEVAALLGLLEKALELALCVIGTADEGLPESLLFEKQGGGGDDDDDDDDEYRREGPTQTAGPGLVVDCRGHLIRSRGGAGNGATAGEGEEDDDDDANGDAEDDTRQRLIVGGWLMAKEAGACLAEIVKQAAVPSSVPLQQKRGATEKRRGELNGNGAAVAPLIEAIGGVERVDAVGQVLLRALGRMKHMGGIQCTQAALLAVTRALLLASPALAALPQQWMEGLLDRLRNPRQHFVLRRSAGLASGFLAIVGAEPPNTPPVLLPQLMEELLWLAEAGEGADWRTRIHALNVLRLLLLDAGPSREASRAYMARAMAVVLQGFRDPRWAVRNSALMVFGTLVIAAVGSGKNTLGCSGAGISRSGSGTTAPSSAHDFLRRHPDFLRIVAAELRRCLRPHDPSGSGSTAAADDDDHLARALAGMGLDDSDPRVTEGGESSSSSDSPSLFPLILLLSRLRPPTEALAEDEQGSALDQALQDCLPLVARCACLPDGLMRLTAARAFASLVGTTRAPATIVALVSALPPSSSSSSSSSDSNVMHGLLLMATTLLRGLLNLARAAHAGDKHKDEGKSAKEDEAPLLTTLLAPVLAPACFPRTLGKRQWLMTDACRCPSICQEAMQLFFAYRQLLRLVVVAPPSDSDSDDDDASAALLHGTLGALQACGVWTPPPTGGRENEAEDAPCRLGPIPGLASLVASSVCWHLLVALDSADPAAFSALLSRGLRQQGMVEVRRESLRVLLLLLSLLKGEREGEETVDLGDGRTEDDRAEHQLLMEQQAAGCVAGRKEFFMKLLQAQAGPAVVRQVQREANPNVLRGQLAALCLLLEGGNSGGARAVGATGLWAFASRLACGADGDEDDGGEIAARALELLGHLLPVKEEEEEEGSAASSWLRRVERAARPEARPSLRMAALRSVAASGLLLQTNAAAPAAVVVGALLATLRLLQDDDDDVREAAGKLLAASLVDPSGRSRPAPPCLDLQANAALARMAAADAGAAHAWVRGVVGILCTRAASLDTTLASHLPSSPSGPGSSSGGGLGLPQQIFCPEPDNVYEELAVAAYWAVRSLLAAMAAVPVCDGWRSVGASSELRGLLLPLVDGETSLLQRAREGSAWVGGLTNHPEVLPGLFVSLLAALLLLVLAGQETDNRKLAARLVSAAGGNAEERDGCHVLVRWALDSLATVLADPDFLGAGGDLGARARRAVACVDWGVVDGYGPFRRADLPAE